MLKWRNAFRLARSSNLFRRCTGQLRTDIFGKPVAWQAPTDALLDRVAVEHVAQGCELHTESAIVQRTAYLIVITASPCLSGDQLGKGRAVGDAIGLRTAAQITNLIRHRHRHHHIRLRTCHATCTPNTPTCCTLRRCCRTCLICPVVKVSMLMGFGTDSILALRLRADSKIGMFTGKGEITNERRAQMASHATGDGGIPLRDAGPRGLTRRDLRQLPFCMFKLPHRWPTFIGHRVVPVGIARL
jgi:hypothetical protein